MSADRDMALALAAPGARPFLKALFGLMTELEQIPAKVTQPTLGLVRVVWWRDALLALDGTKPHPLLEEMRPFAAKSDQLAAYAETFGDVFDGESQAKPRAELLASLFADVLGAPLPLLYQAGLAIEDETAVPELHQRMRAAGRTARRASAPLLFLALAPTCRTPLGRAWLAVRLTLGI